MEWPIVAPGPVVSNHAAVFRDLFDHQCQLRHVQHDLTGLIVLPNKRLAKIARCMLDSADTTNRSRLLSEASWREDAVHRRRIRFMLQQTAPPRQRRRESRSVMDDTLCEQVGSRCDDVDRHDNHRDGPYPVAHNPGTGFSVSGPVRFPLGLRLYRRYAALTQWEAAVAQHFPTRQSPTTSQARNRLPQQVEPVLLQDSECRARHEQFRTKMALAIDLVDEALGRKVPFGVVVFDAWYLAEELVRGLARRRKAWSSRRNKNRGLETASVHLRATHGWPLKLPGPRSAVKALVPLLPANASRPVTVREQPYWGFTLAVRIPSLGQGRIVVSFEPESLTGRSVVLVTHRVDWSAAKLISLYGQRGPTETCYQDRQGPRGFNTSRMRRTEALGTHGCLVVVAYALVHRTCLPTVPDRTRPLIPSLGDACRQQGRAVRQQLLGFVHDQLSHGATVDHVLAQLFAKQRGMAPI
jgi:DDE superfamily endonuclease